MAVTKPLGRLSARDLFRLMVIVESHAVVIGPTGVGKTSLIKNALTNIPRDYTVLVLDVHGGYEGYTDYHAPYPLNPLDYLSPGEVLEGIEEAFTIKGQTNVVTPAMAYNWLRYASWLDGGNGLFRPPENLDVNKYGRSLSGVISLIRDAVEEGLVVSDDAESSKGLLRRLVDVDHWMFRETHPLLARLLRGELSGRSVGIDITVFRSDVSRWFYVISLLKAMYATGIRKLIMVVDEAHLFMVKGAITLMSNVRVGRNYERYFVLMSQSPKDIPSEVFSMNRLFVEFPVMYTSYEELSFREVGWKRHYGRDTYYDPTKTWERQPPPYWQVPHRAVIHLQATTRRAMEALGRPFLIEDMDIDVDVPPKPSTTTLTKCAKEAGVDPQVIRKNGFSTIGPLGKSVAVVWECLAR